MSTSETDLPRLSRRHHPPRHEDSLRLREEDPLDESVLLFRHRRLFQSPRELVQIRERLVLQPDESARKPYRLYGVGGRVEGEGGRAHLRAGMILISTETKKPSVP